MEILAESERFWNFLETNPNLKFSNKLVLRSIFGGKYHFVYKDIKCTFEDILLCLSKMGKIRVNGEISYLENNSSSNTNSNNSSSNFNSSPNINSNSSNSNSSSNTDSNNSNSLKSDNNQNPSLTEKQRKKIEFEFLSQNKGGIEVTPLNFQNAMQLGDEPLRASITIFNRRSEAVRFWIDFIEKPGEFSCSLNSISKKGFKIEANSKYSITFEFKPNTQGIFKLFFFIKFLTGSKNPLESSFNIARASKIEVIIFDEIYESIKSEGPYRKIPENIKKKYTIEPGIRPSFGETTNKKKMPSYEVPRNIRNLIETDNEPVLKTIALMDIKNSYSQKFKNLLHFEELQMEVDIRKYDRESTMTSSKDRSKLILKVDGLAEKRPSVLFGDRVYALHPNGSIEYEGYVHRVEQEYVHLAFSQKFHAIHIENQKYQIRFTFARTPLKRMHNALELTKEPYINLPNVQNVVISNVNSLPFQRKGNQRQLQAVRCILERRKSPIQSPYIIFGPPGTGKTFTVVEAILQLSNEDPKLRILACAPSNSAADNIARGIQNFINKVNLLRLNAYQRDRSEGADLTCTVSYGAPFDILKYQVVVCTCVTAALIDDTNKFSFIFIDEAGHALEPEALIPIANHLNKNGTLVLAGDPKQLGPIIRSKWALMGELDISMIERLTEKEEIYKKSKEDWVDYGNYNPALITKLLVNYRSHEGLLSLPNKLFYDGELRTEISDQSKDRYCKYVTQVTKGTPNIPMIFHGIPGKDEREGNSPSWFNTHEVLEVIKKISDLQENVKQVDLKTIGIIAPYRKQVQKIRTALKKKNWDDKITVGSVEEFQGQERDVIIISTVRSNVENLSFDYKYNLGFLKNPKRFNVAITRAKSLLIIIGNPNVLQHDLHWRKLLEYALEQKLYIGCKFEFKTEKTISDNNNESIDEEDGFISQKTRIEEPAWDSKM